MHWRLRRRGALAFCTLAAVLLCACQPRKPYPPVLDGGNARQGKLLLAQFQCGSCHQIPGVEAARGRTGPSLEEFARRSYIAGRWPNRQATLVRWVSAPRSMDPATIMPDMGVSADDARHIAAYLYSLE
jgi:cytochrome c2